MTSPREDTPLALVSPRQLRAWADAGVLDAAEYVAEMRRRANLQDPPPPHVRAKAVRRRERWVWQDYRLERDGAAGWREVPAGAPYELGPNGRQEIKP